MKHSSVYFDDELVHLWDQFADPAATITNTHLLMRLAARPFFDFFVQDIDTIVKSDTLGGYKTIVAQAQASAMPAVLLSSADISDPDPFGNVEGVWKKIRQKLNPLKFEQVFVAMGPERAWIIPRIASVYKVPVYDISYTRRQPEPSKILLLAKKVAKRLLRR